MKKQIESKRQMKSLFIALLSVIFLLAANIESAAQTSDFRGYKTGRYEGEAHNTTYNVRDKYTLEIKTIDRTTGEVTASVAPTGGRLSGAGTLTGRIDENGILRLSGPILNWTMKVVGRVNGNTIKANYYLEGSSPQEGNLLVTLVNSSQTVNSRISAADVSGAWKGTYTCAQGLTNLVLSLSAKSGGDVEGIFTFLFDDGSLLGSYKVKGTFDSRSGKIELKGTDWDEQPSGYALVDLSGNLRAGRMSGTVIGNSGCTTFQLEKIKFK